MAEIGILNKQHPLYQEDLKRIWQAFPHHRGNRTDRCLSDRRPDES